MPSHQISPAEENLPPLELPSGALDASHPDYQNTTDSDPPEIEPIEHRIRVDIVEAGDIKPSNRKDPGRPLVRQYIQQSLVDTYEREQQFFPRHDDVDTFLEGASAFLTDKLAQYYEDIETVRSNRQNWYFNLIPKNLDTIQDTLDSLEPIGSNTFHGVVIVDADTDRDMYAADQDLDPADVIHEPTLDNHIMPSAYGIGLPAPLLVGEFASGSTYAFLPWSDAVVCGCPYKQTNKWAVMCKHELATASRLANADIDALDAQYVLPVDIGVDVPQRARRFVSPTIAATHTPRRPR